MAARLVVRTQACFANRAATAGPITARRITCPIATHAVTVSAATRTAASTATVDLPDDGAVHAYQEVIMSLRVTFGRQPFRGRLTGTSIAIPIGVVIGLAVVAGGAAEALRLPLLFLLAFAVGLGGVLTP